jgi:hypothetical protein
VGVVKVGFHRRKARNKSFVKVQCHIVTGNKDFEHLGSIRGSNSNLYGENVSGCRCVAVWESEQNVVQYS